MRDEARARSVEDDSEAATAVTSRVCGTIARGGLAWRAAASSANLAYVSRRKLLKFQAATSKLLVPGDRVAGCAAMSQSENLKIDG